VNVIELILLQMYRYLRPNEAESMSRTLGQKKIIKNNN
jgi:hypothetical protein